MNILKASENINKKPEAYSSPAGNGGSQTLEPGRVDLHSHSTASDGRFSPAALAEAAVKAGLLALALTDHDTVEGLDEFYAAGKTMGLKAIGGIEISLEHPGTMHLLGLNVNDNDETPKHLNRLKTFRMERNLKMLDALGRLGYYLPWEKLLKISGGGQMGRPHFAALLLEKGYFKTREEVFDKMLGKGRPGYVNKKRLTPEEGISLLREAGWAPVLAHPLSLGLSHEEWPSFLKYLADIGLIGLEVRHPSHNQNQIEYFQSLAERFNLAPTAGSDFHGGFKPAASLDWIINNSIEGLEMLDRLRDRS